MRKPIKMVILAVLVHGEVEVYNDQGKHQGAFDPDTGEQIDPPDPTKTAPN
jgi:hypothetical protein